MLEEEIVRQKAAMQHQEVNESAAVFTADDWAPQITTGIPIMIPENYVKDLGVRLGLYKRIGSLKNNEEILDMREELIDRFGPIPPEVDDYYMASRRQKKRIERIGNKEKITTKKVRYDRQQLSIF